MRTRRSPLTWLGALLVVYLIFPIVAFLVRTSHSGQRGFGEPGLWAALRTSAESATIATAIGVVFAIPLGYALARNRGRIARAVGVLVHLPLALPPVVSGVLLVYVLGPYTTIGQWFDGRLTGSVAGIVAAQLFVSAPFLVIAARSAFAAIDPSLEDLAAALGHGALNRFFRVDIVAAAPWLKAGLLLMWLRALGEYGANVVLAYHPYSLPVFTYVQFSGTGIPYTQAPTLLVLAAAAVAGIVTAIRRPAWTRRAPVIPIPVPPPVRRPEPVAFDVDVRAGQFHLHLAHAATSHRLAILGPSGSGKSMTLRSIAGLLHPTKVSYGGEDVTDVPTERRRLGYVPQGQRLFPTLNVWQQANFGIRAEPARAAWWLDTLGLSDLTARLPSELSGGQVQRASLAAALAGDPRVVLLDEPFSALDMPVRRELQMELRRLQLDAGLSTVLVTHDPEEAALLADEVVVIAEGRLLQAGPLPDVYRHPATPEVARLLGIDNVLPATVAGPASLDVAGVIVEVSEVQLAGLAPGQPVLWSVPSERPRVSVAGGSGRMIARVLDYADLGMSTLMCVNLAGGADLHVRVGGSVPLSIGDTCVVEIPPDAITVWPTGAPGDGLFAGGSYAGRGEVAVADRTSYETSGEVDETGGRGRSQ